MSAPEPRSLDAADVARVSLALFVVVVVQYALLDAVRVDGAHPDVVLLAAAAAGYVGGPERGAGVGFCAGLVSDLFVPTTFGLGALVGCLLGFAVGIATTSLVRSSRWLGLLALTGATVAGLVLYAVVSSLLGQPGTLSVDLAPALVVATPAAVVLGLPVLGLVRWAVPPPVPPAASAPPGAVGR